MIKKIKKRRQDLKTVVNEDIHCALDKIHDNLVTYTTLTSNEAGKLINEVLKDIYWEEE